jgi:DNA-binding SARP family transcriptional activator
MTEVNSLPTGREAGIVEWAGPPQFRIELLGGFRFTVASAPIELQKPAKRLLATLAIHRKPLQRSFVAGLLWPDVLDERASGNLRSTIYRLGEVRAVVEGRTLLSLHRDAQVDVVAVTRAASQVIAAPTSMPATDALDALAASGELLPDWYDDWLVVERERFNQLRLLALDCLVRHLLPSGRVAEATVAALAAAAIDPCRESTQRLLIECHIAQGNRDAALRQFRSYASALRRLGLEPSSTITAIVAALTASVVDAQDRRRTGHGPVTNRARSGDEPGTVL